MTSWPTKSAATYKLLLVFLVLGLGFTAVVLSTAAVDPPPLLRVSTHLWPGYAPLFRARDLGVLDGKSLRLIELPTASGSSRGLRSGVLEASSLTLDEALRAQAAGTDLRIIAVLDHSIGGDALVVRAPITRIADLRGKSVGVELDGVGALFLDRALRSTGLSIADVTPVGLEADEHEVALLSGRVDAVVTFEPRVHRLRQTGAVVLADSSDVPGEIIDVLVVKSEQIQTDPQGVRALAKGAHAALDEIRAGIGIAETASSMHMTEAELDAGLREIRLPTSAESWALVTGASPDLITSARAVADEMRRTGLLDGPVDPDRLMLTSEEAASLR